MNEHMYTHAHKLVCKIQFPILCGVLYHVHTSSNLFDPATVQVRKGICFSKECHLEIWPGLSCLLKVFRGVKGYRNLMNLINSMKGLRPSTKVLLDKELVPEIFFFLNSKSYLKH